VCDPVAQLDYQALRELLGPEDLEAALARGAASELAQVVEEVLAKG
jgi:hypothetical protein